MTQGFKTGLRVIGIAVVLAGALDFLANWLAAHFLVPFGPFLVPGGTFVFALTFTVYDFIRRQGGIVPTLCAIALGFIASVLYAAVFGGGIGRIAVAGLIALVFSSATDLAVQTITLRWPIWRYVATSNIASLLIDSLVFTFIAFSMLPTSVQVTILEGQFLVKVLVTLASIPLVYAAREATLRWAV